MTRIGGAVALALVALFMFVGFLGSGAALAAPATLGALALTVLLPAGWAIVLVRGHSTERARIGARRADLLRGGSDAEILRLARDQGGRLAAVEVAMEMGTSPETAKGWLDALVERRHAELEITDDGLLVYTFYDVRYLGGKERARDVLHGGPPPPPGARRGWGGARSVGGRGRRRAPPRSRVRGL